MNLSAYPHPSHRLLIITAIVLLTLASLKTTDAHTYRLPSYNEGLQMVADAVSQASSDNAAGKSKEMELVRSGLMQLQLPQVQAMVLESMQELPDGDLTADEGQALLMESVGVDEDQAVQNTTSVLCLNHTVATVAGLLERSGWALQMLDAMGKPSPGIQDGNVFWPGAYKQCLNVRANATDVPLHPYFAGQYCTLRLLPTGPAATPSLMSVQIGVGICVPDTCSSTDLTILVNSVLAGLKNSSAMLQSIQLAVTCEEPKSTLDGKAIAALFICSIFLLFMVVGTAMDVLFVQLPKWRMEEKVYSSTNGYSSGDGNAGEHLPLLATPDTTVRAPVIGFVGKIFLSFSVYTNGSKLLSTKQSAGSLDCVHGIRFLSMTWVVLGHSLIFPITFGALNTGPYLQEVIQRWSFQAIANATVSVDTFFVLSGLLVAYLSLKEMNKRGGKLNWFLFFFHRFWRLTPAYMLVIMVYVCFTPYWGEGPLWANNIPDRDNCKTSWWANLLYINNLATMDKMCLAQSWYLANDMQFYILSPLIFVPFYYSPIFGTVSSIVFLIVTSVVPGALTMKDHFPPGLLPNQLEGNTTNTNQMDFMNDFYIKPYNRMGPYIVGMLAGYFLYRTDCRLRINKIVNLSLWALATGCALAVLYGLYDASNGHPITLPVSAFYNAVNRQVWGACVAWVVVACVTGNGGFVNTILSWSALVPLSRLTYCIYLLHIMMMELYLLNSNTSFYMDDLNVVMFFLGILVVSYMAAAVTSLAFEAPLMMLEKVLFHRTKKRRQKRSGRPKLVPKHDIIRQLIFLCGGSHFV